MKKDIALFSIWILLFATFGPVASVSATTGECGDQSCGWLWKSKCSPDEMCVEKAAGEWCEKSEACIESGDRLDSIGAVENMIRCFDAQKGIIVDSSEKTPSSTCVACIVDDPQASNVGCCKYKLKAEWELLLNANPLTGPQKTILELWFQDDETTYAWSAADDCDLGNIFDFFVDSDFTGDNLKCEQEATNAYPSSVKCDVINFNLPQDPSTTWSTVAAAKEWIRGMGDPDYIVYYEAFPEGEEEAWQIPGNEMFVMFLVIEGVFSMIPLIGKGGGKIAVEALEESGEAAAKLATKEAIKESAGRTTATKLASWGAKVTLKFKGVAQKIGSFIKNSHGGKKGVAETLDDIPTKIDEFTGTLPYTFFGAGDDVIDSMPPSVFSDTFEGITKVEAKTLLRDTVKNNFKATVKGGIERYSMIPANIRNKVMASKIETAKEIWANPAVRLYAVDMYDTIDTEWTEGEKDGFWDMVIKSGIVLSRPGAGGATELIKSTAVLSVLGFSLAWTDSINGKYIPVGVNQMALHIPFYPTQEMDLGTEAHKHYVELVRDSGIFTSSFMRQDPARFFLVSPCSADLKVRKAMRACREIGANYDDIGVLDEEKHFEYYTDPSDTSSLVEMSKITVPDEKTLSPGGYVSEDFEAAKFCVTGYSDTWFFQKEYYHDSIPAIQIDPKILSDEKNFCYAGSHIWQDSMETVVTIISIAISIGTSGAGAVLAGPVAVIINHQISQTEYWPNH